eukprot:9497296-Pyramimonas_sp.AAC.1
MTEVSITGHTFKYEKHKLEEELHTLIGQTITQSNATFAPKSAGPQVQTGAATTDRTTYLT